MHRVTFAPVVFALAVLVSSAAGAQPLGTFRWQLQPFCNVVTLAVTQNGGVYRLEGTDDQCGNGADQASAIGTAFLNPDGSIGIGLSIVSSPNATPINIDAAIALATLGGSWRDTTGNAGSFTFTPGAGSGGSPRPLPSPVIGDVTGVIAGAGLSGGGSGGEVAIAVDSAAIQTRVSGSCAAGQAMRTINQNGTVACEALSSGGGDVTGVIAGAGLTGGGLAGEVAIAVDGAVVQNRVSGTCAAGQAVRSVNQNGTVACEFIPAGVPPAILLRADGTVVAAGGSGGPMPIPASGPGTRLMWYPSQAAFRAGIAEGAEWDPINLGFYSVALGDGTLATEDGSVALGSLTAATGAFATSMGQFTRASGNSSTAMGKSGIASAHASTAMGFSTQASGEFSVAMGDRSKAIGKASTALGQEGDASGIASTVMGISTEAVGNASTAMGSATSAVGDFSVAMGDRTVAGGAASLAAGRQTSAGGASSVALGSFVSASTGGTFMFGDRSTMTPMQTFTANQFLVRAAGGTGIYSNATLTTGVELAPNGNAWSSLSDSTKKTAFRDLSHDEVLDKIAQMGVSEWSYIAQDPSIRHIGPTAQDFYAAFRLGEDPLRISTIDADGVALAAIRALEARTRAMQAAMRETIATLESELAALRAIVRAGAK